MFFPNQPGSNQTEAYNWSVVPTVPLPLEDGSEGPGPNPLPQSDLALGDLPVVTRVPPAQTFLSHDGGYVVWFKEETKPIDNRRATTSMLKPLPSCFGPRTKTRTCARVAADTGTSGGP